MLMKSVLIFLMLTLVLFSASARPKKGKGPNRMFFDAKKAALYTDFELSGGYESSSERSFPVVKLKAVIAEGVFGNFSVSSSAALAYGYCSGDSLYSLGLCVPDICFGYKFKNLLPYAGGGFYQNWYIAKEESNGVSFTTTIHSYGYSLYTGLNYSLTEYFGLFAEYEIHPHTWMVTTGNSDIEWIYPQQFTAGISVNIPWSL